MKNIYLIGFMGSGKSTVARYLQNEYQLELVEMDSRIEENEGCSISQIFAEKGEAYFRDLETGLLREISKRSQVVVSCGGGTAMRECNVQEMKQHGTIVLLNASPEAIYERVKNTHNRPLLEGNMTVEYIRSLMDARMNAYQTAADCIVNTENRTISEICSEIVQFCK